MKKPHDKSRRRFLGTAASLGGAICLAPAALGQFEFHDGEMPAPLSGGPRIGNTKTQIFRAGVKFVANGTSLDNMRVAVPIPMDWGEEQKTKIVDEKPPEPGVKLEILENARHYPGCKILLYTARKLNVNREMEMTMTIETTRAEMLPPPEEETMRLVIPAKSPKGFDIYLRPGPKVECKERKFVNLFNEIVRDKKGESDWKKVEAIYDYVREKIAYDGGYKDKEAKGALATITDGKWRGDCKDMTFVFIAICRAGRIPARTVRLPTHCYAEFYLEEKPQANAAPKTDRKGSKTPVNSTGHWFPCQLAGDRAFGGIPGWDPILQKGDSYPDMNDPKERLYYFNEQFYADGTNGIKPRFSFIHELKGR